MTSALNTIAKPTRPFRFRRLALRAGLLLGLLALAGWLALQWVPLPEALFRPAPTSLELFDRHGIPLREMPTHETRFSQSAAYAEFPKALIDATLAAEDARFWSHQGVDVRATMRAAWSLARHRRIVSGGSTITQQLIKLTGRRPRTFPSKLVEALQALRLEQVWDKQRILCAYINRLDYGNLCAGPHSAAQFYFGKPMRDLSVAECAFLAGLPQAPTRLNPRLHLDRAQQRQLWILGRMEILGRLTVGEHLRASREPLRLVFERRAFLAPHFADFVLARVHEDAFKNIGRPASGRIITSLDLELNRIVERALRHRLARLRSQRVRNGAVVILDNRSGGVLALVGSENYFAPETGQVNGAWAARSAGSTLKPFTYLLALERGATPASIVADIPVEFVTPTGVFAPVNYDRRCYGPMRYREALANSLNISAVKILDSMGGPAVLQDRLQAWGLTTLTQDASFYGLGLTLGNAEVRLLELVNAYAALARLGESQPFQLLATPAEREVRPAHVLAAPDAAWLIADILSDNAARSLVFGLDSSLRFDFPVACKTGTSTDFRDNWAIGYTPEFTVGVWVGNFDGTPMEQVSGVTGAAPLLHDLFEYLHARYGTSWYQHLPTIVERRINSITGRLAKKPSPATVLEKFIAGRLPEAEGVEDYDAAGRVRVLAEYEAWRSGPDNWLGNRLALEYSTAMRLRLISPQPGTTLILDPDLPSSSRLLPLKAEGGRSLIWRSETLECTVTKGGSLAKLKEGRHRLTVKCSESGEQLETWVVVKEL